MPPNLKFTTEIPEIQFISMQPRKVYRSFRNQLDFSRAAI